MNSVIVSSLPAIIAGVVAIFIALMQNSPKRTSEIYEKQLSEIFLPMHKLLERKYFENYTFSDNEISVILENMNIIIFDNYVFIPNSLMVNFKKAKYENSNIEIAGTECFNNLCEYIDISYKFLRKQLGYSSSSIIGSYSCLDFKSRSNLTLFPQAVIISLCTAYIAAVGIDPSQPLMLRVFGTGLEGFILLFLFTLPLIFSWWLLSKLK